MSYNVAEESNKSRIAKERLNAKINVGHSAQIAVLEQVANTVIKDALVAPADMTFSWDKGLAVNLASKIDLRVHSHTVSQIAEIFKYPKTYMNMLQQGIIGISRTTCINKMLGDMNWHAHNAQLKDRRRNPAKYLCRHVSGELRGFLSRNYKRHLASSTLLKAFVTSCSKCQLVPIGASTSPIRVNLQCALPYVFEPVDGEFVAVGVAWSNSDFGSGRMKVSMCLHRLASDSSIILNDVISKVHIGSVIEESDLELSDETHRAELEAQKLAIDDAVAMQIGPDQVEKLLDVIKVASEAQISWTKLKQELTQILQKQEIEDLHKMLTSGSSYEELPPVSYDNEDDPIATRWWVASALGSMAGKESDAEKKKAMQEFAGETLNKNHAKRAA